jgi:hypothetical protein
MNTEAATINGMTANFEDNHETYEKYYARACRVCVPILLKVPVYVAPVVIEKEPVCLDKNEH